MSPSNSSDQRNAFDELSDTMACAIVLLVMLVGILAGGYVAHVVSSSMTAAEIIARH